MSIDELAQDQDVRNALKHVIDRFLNLKQTTPRPHVHRKLRGKGNLIGELLGYEFLQQPVNDEMVPGILAFQRLDDEYVLNLATVGTSKVLFTLKNLFEADYKNRRFSATEISEHAGQIYDHVLPEELRLGMLLVPNFNSFVAGVLWSEGGSSFESISVHDHILDFASIDMEWKHRLDEITARQDRKPQVVKSQTSENMPAANRKKIFVIHGRNEMLRQAMFDFLRALGLEPMEWSQLLAGTGKGAPYTGEVIDFGFRQAAAVVCLLTPDDYAFLNPQLLRESDKDFERKPTPQARPNVLFELGMAFAHHPDRTIIVEVGELRPFSDVTGRHTIRFDGKEKSRFDLRGRLKTAGCDVNEYGTDFLIAGDFAIGATPAIGTEASVNSGGTTRVSGNRPTVTVSRQAYSLAISVLRSLHGEAFQGNQGLPGYLWTQKDGSWFKITKRLGSINGNTGGFVPYIEPSQFDSDDLEKSKAAKKILELYLWASENNADFEAIRSAYDLPRAEEVQRLLGELP